MNQNRLAGERYLNSLIPRLEPKPGSVLRLERISHLLELTGHPEKSFPSIHVGGTAGKGSVCYILAEVLKQAGYKTGLHISPHLERVNERMQINGAPISDRDFTELVSWIRPFVTKVRRRSKWGSPTYFEALVAMSFEYFRRRKVDIAVIEVGLGGTLDATNVIRPLAAVITNIHLDHTHILGSTVEKIARDKAGIIKEGIDVITAATQKSALDIMRRRCREKHARLQVVKAPKRLLPTALLGSHQQLNIACALAAVRALNRHGFRVSRSAVTTALQSVHVPGRFEVFLPGFGSRKNLAVLDGAHNPVKMKALAAALKSEFPQQKIVFIVAVKKTKDVKGMMRCIAPIAKKFFITRFRAQTDMGGGASMEPKEIAKAIRIWNKTVPIQITPNSRRTLKTAQAQTNTHDIICVTGSLYLVGEIRGRFKEKNRSS